MLVCAALAHGVIWGSVSGCGAFGWFVAVPGGAVLLAGLRRLSEVVP